MRLGFLKTESLDGKDRQELDRRKWGGNPETRRAEESDKNPNHTKQTKKSPKLESKI